MNVLRDNSLVAACLLAMAMQFSFLGTLCAQKRDKTPTEDSLIVVVGAPGDNEYTTEFESWASNWKQVAKRQSWEFMQLDSGSADLSQKEELKRSIEKHDGHGRLWVVLIGHGTFSRNTAKFNLVGEDVSSEEFDEWLQTLESPLVLINCFSSSGPFLAELSDPRRILLTATRAGSEINYSRFGKFLSLAVNDLEADIDHDQEVSLLEAFLSATSETERFYQSDARLTTEHALLDDNGDRSGTSAVFYRGIRPAKATKSGKDIDGAAAARIILYSSPQAPVFSSSLAERRALLEKQIDMLRSRKEELAHVEYFDQLEQLLLKLASVYDEAEQVAE